MKHIVGKPEGMRWNPCTHRATKQHYAVLTESNNVETTSGTVAARAGDHLMLDEDGETVYVLRPEEYRQKFEEGH